MPRNYDPGNWYEQTRKKSKTALIKKGMSATDAEEKVTSAYIAKQWKTRWIIRYLKREGVPDDTIPKSWNAVLKHRSADGLKMLAKEAWDRKVDRDIEHY